jgi:hypothetical protein
MALLAYMHCGPKPRRVYSVHRVNLNTEKDIDELFYVERLDDAGPADIRVSPAPFWRDLPIIQGTSHKPARTLWRVRFTLER